MKKKLFLLVGVCVGILLGGCGSYSTEIIQFRQFSFDFRNNDLVYNRVVGKNLETNSLDDLLYAAYIADEEDVILDENEIITPYYNSLLLSEAEVDADLELKSFVDLNMNKSELVLQGYSSNNSQEYVFDCNGTEVSGILEEFKAVFVDKELIYFGKYFFKHGAKIYIISFSSEDKNERDDFVSSLKTMRCG